MMFEIIRLRDGDGETFPKAGDCVTFQCIRRLTLGQQVYETKINLTALVGIGHLIPACDQGLLRLSLGEVASITANSGNSRLGLPAHAPKNTPIVYEISLQKIN